ncbi:uncharacterized protein ACHE_51126S [Aspergillus chevalieri]|uniref:Uncharacterized protein n=1 Tax=Aspergillus chevalieri TaxID=182096 RepID=A0A7R7ZPS8_ASPCH|nr:uncharacterized protein ACHE_51126S [Aspergillus chevalieri]BCR89928.1 hypothetical protein ACHE_51126S [Aspergillus chevalieri]
MATHAAAGVEPISLVQDVLDNAYLVVQRVSGEQTVEEIGMCKAMEDLDILKVKGVEETMTLAGNGFIGNFYPRLSELLL